MAATSMILTEGTEIRRGNERQGESLIKPGKEGKRMEKEER